MKNVLRFMLFAYIFCRYILFHLGNIIFIFICMLSCTGNWKYYLLYGNVYEYIAHNRFCLMEGSLYILKYAIL